MNPETRAQQALTDITVVTTLHTPAVRQATDWLAGYGTSTPGAAPADTQPIQECSAVNCTNNRPCPDHSPPVEMTATEQSATQSDKARIDLENYYENLRHLSHHARRCAEFVIRYGQQGVTQTDVKNRIAAIDRNIWCDNCGQYGWKETRLPEHIECDFCSQFRKDYGRPCPKEVLDIKRYRTHVSEADKQRVLNTIDPDWRRKLTKKRKGKAA